MALAEILPVNVRSLVDGIVKLPFAVINPEALMIGAVMVPVNVGLAVGAFVLIWVWAFEDNVDMYDKTVGVMGIFRGW